MQCSVAVQDLAISVKCEEWTGHGRFGGSDWGALEAETFLLLHKEVRPL